MQRQTTKLPKFNLPPKFPTMLLYSPAGSLWWSTNPLHTHVLWLVLKEVSYHLVCSPPRRGHRGQDSKTDHQTTLVPRPSRLFQRKHGWPGYEATPNRQIFQLMFSRLSMLLYSPRAGSLWWNTSPLHTLAGAQRGWLSS